jgi:hypothetical protein
MKEETPAVNEETALFLSAKSILTRQNVGCVAISEELGLSPHMKMYDTEVL